MNFSTTQNYTNGSSTHQPNEQSATSREQTQLETTIEHLIGVLKTLSEKLAPITVKAGQGIPLEGGLVETNPPTPMSQWIRVQKNKIQEAHRRIQDIISGIDL